MSATASKERITLRANSRIKQRVKRAAQVLGVTLTDFIKQTVVKEADEVLATREKTVLSDEDRDAFLAALEQDTPNEALQDAVGRHNDMSGA